MSFWDRIKGGASDLWEGTKHVVSEVGSGIGDVASGAYHAVADTASSVYHTGVNVANAASGYIARGEEAIGNGVHWMEDKVNVGTHDLAAYVKDVPVLGSVAEGAADALTFASQVGGGVVGGATSLIGGAANSLLHPIDTARGLESMAEHFPVLGTGLKAAHGLVDVATGDATLDQVGERISPGQSLDDDAKYWGNVGNAIVAPYKKSMAEGRPGEIVGRGVFDIATLISGAGAAGAASKTGEAASVARVAESADVARAADAASVARVAEGADVARTAEAAGAARVGEGAEAAQAADAGDVARATATKEAQGATASEVRGQGQLSETGPGHAQAVDGPSTLSEARPDEYTRQAPYDPAAWRDYFDAKYPGQVESATAAPKTARNASLAETGMRHPKTGVVFDRRRFPILDDIAKYQTRVPDEIAALRKPKTHMRHATRDLRRAVEAGEVPAGTFTEEQLAAIRSGKAEIPDLTWHHHQERGRLQLSDQKIHAETGHMGGMDTWY